jgi:hypothetical protein
MRILICSLALPLLGLAQGSSVGGSYLKFPASARLAALGEAVIADPSVLSSGGINPANIFSTSAGSLLISNAQWIQNITQQNLAFSLPLAQGTAAFGVTRSSVPDVQIRTIPGPLVGTFDPQAAIFTGSFATKLSDNLIVGITGKYIYEKIYVDESTGFAADLGMLLKTPIEGLSAAVALTNLGSLSAFRVERVDLPRRYSLGLSYAFSELQLQNRAYASAVFDKSATGSSFFFGIQSMYEQAVFARLGYQTGIEARGFSLGLGAAYSIGQFDYAFLPFSSGLGSSHIISLEFLF